MKKCKKCNQEKELVFFGKSINIKDGFKNECKECVKKYMTEYYLLNKDTIKDKNLDKKNERYKYNKKWKNDNHNKVIEYNKIYRNNNINSIKEKRKINYINNKEEILKYQSEYKKRNPPNKNTINSLFNKKYQNDELFRLRHNIRTLIRQSIKNGGYSKNSKTIDIIGCSFEQLSEHLNNNPYGFKYEDKLYDVDHIIPISNASTEEEILKLNHYTNLQLLPSEYNRNIKKSSEWNPLDFEYYLITSYFFENSFLSEEI
jgi:hypothetical protein